MINGNSSQGDNEVTKACQSCGLKSIKSGVRLITTRLLLNYFKHLHKVVLPMWHKQHAMVQGPHQGELKGGRNHAVVTTTSAAPVTQQPRHERTFSPLRDNSFNQITTASTSSSVFPAPSRSSRGIRCFTCGTLFSREGNSQCQARRIKGGRNCF